MDVADKKRFHYTTGYLEDHANVLSMFKTKDSKNLRWLSAKEKLIFLSTYSIKHHKDTTGRDIFYSVYNRTSPVLFHGVPSILVYYPRKIQCLFVPKIFHENSNTNFLKELKYIGERTDIDTPGYSEFPNEFGRNLYEYRNKTSDPQTITLTIDDQDWHCHILIICTYFKSVGTTITGSDFEFSNASRRLLAAFEPGSNLLNLESGTTTVTHFLIKDDFYLQQKPITDLIKKYNNFPGEYFVNESYFLYDKSNLIKNTYITAINKAISIYGSFSYFKGKSANEKLTH